MSCTMCPYCGKLQPYGEWCIKWVGVMAEIN